MTFGIKYGDVVDRLSCPRCGSEKAVVRGLLRSQEAKTYENTLTCEKCHLVDFQGLVSVEYNLDQKQLLRMKNLLKKAKTKRDKTRIENKILNIEERMKVSGLLQFGGSR